jgi:hypothetical protein
MEARSEHELPDPSGKGQKKAWENRIELTSLEDEHLA